MSLLDKILTAIFGPDDARTLEEAEADYIAAKERYEDAVKRGDTRDQNKCLKALNVALNVALAAHYDAAGLYKYSADRRPLSARFSVRSRPARA